MKIIITGANGYIGARLCQYLSAKAHDIIAVCYPSIPKVDYWGRNFYKVMCGDIRKQKTIEQIADLKADVIIHLISLDHYDSEKDLHFVSEINVLPTWNLLKECTKTGLKKFIYFCKDAKIELERHLLAIIFPGWAKYVHNNRMLQNKPSPAAIKKQL